MKVSRPILNNVLQVPTNSDANETTRIILQMVKSVVGIYTKLINTSRSQNTTTGERARVKFQQHYSNQHLVTTND